MSLFRQAQGITEKTVTLHYLSCGNSSRVTLRTANAKSDKLAQYLLITG